jgi:hypothetical protein
MSTHAHTRLKPLPAPQPVCTNQDAEPTSALTEAELVTIALNAATASGREAMFYSMFAQLAAQIARHGSIVEHQATEFRLAFIQQTERLEDLLDAQIGALQNLVDRRRASIAHADSDANPLINLQASASRANSEDPCNHCGHVRADHLGGLGQCTTDQGCPKRCTQFAEPPRRQQ